MRALTLWQPWATLVAIGAKRIETRSWTTSYRGPLAIHAAMSTRGHEAYWREPFFAELRVYHYNRPHELPHGRIIAVCELTDILPTEDVRGIIENRELAFGDYGDGRYAWRLENIHRLPIEMPARGYQGLWQWDYSGETAAIQRMIYTSMDNQKGDT